MAPHGERKRAHVAQRQRLGHAAVALTHAEIDARRRIDEQRRRARLAQQHETARLAAALVQHEVEELLRRVCGQGEWLGKWVGACKRRRRQSEWVRITVL